MVFFLLFACCRNNEKPGNWYPETFSVDKVEKTKWVLAFKLMGPPCETLSTGDDECHEFLANPTGYVSFCAYICIIVDMLLLCAGLATRGTGTPIRKTKKLGRKDHRESKVKQRLTEKLSLMRLPLSKLPTHSSLGASKRSPT